MSPSKTNGIGTAIGFALSIVIVAFAGWLFLNRQFALDQLTVWNYQPSASIKEINQKVQFTDKGLFAFYAAQPVVASPSEFNAKCPRQETGSPILGCYTSDDHIYVFDVTNQRLDGIKEVTAAHEMLHAVWQRTPQSEQTRIGGLLSAAYDRVATPELRQRMAYYERNEPGAIDNELHSILGTEVSGLGPELESYYVQFFKNRQAILDLHAQYSTVYTTLNNRAVELSSSMSVLATSIQKRSAEYSNAVIQLTGDINQFNARANNGSFSSMSQFNSERALLVRRSAGLEAERGAINRDINAYDEMYKEYQSIASQIELLQNSMDSFKALDKTPTV